MERKKNKIIKLNEVDIINIVKSVLKEQENQYDYILYKDNSIREKTPAEELYLVKNGSSFDVFARKSESNIIQKTGYSLPLVSELSLQWNGSHFENYGEAEIANQISSLIKTNYEKSQGNWVVFTKEDGKPAIGVLGLGPAYPLDILEKYNKTKKKLKPNEVFTPKDFFMVDKNKGRSIEVKDMVEAKPYQGQ
jgi:hypothetical protein